MLGVRQFLFAFLVSWLTVAARSAPAADAPSGEKIYKQQCASCHGANGQGVADQYPNPLAGDRSLAELTKLIAKTMPQDDPGTCTGDDAEAVATYIYDAFYSPIAQVRIRPARIELQRLTVRQYRNAAADLLGTFLGSGGWNDERGLKAEYYKARRFRNNDRVLERTDDQVSFDFGTESPVAEKIEPHEFSIRWEGSLLAPETGEYEFVVRTEHAARLWVNDTNTERGLIDAWVKSGSDTEYRGSMYLLGGRTYPLKLEFSKAKQGVDDSKKTKEPPKSAPASIALCWKIPLRAEEVIPKRNFSPSRVPQTFVVSTPFPPDDRSMGYERGTMVSKEWDAATTEAAIEIASYIGPRLSRLANTRDGDESRSLKLKEFCGKFAERAFRRPLTDDERQLYVDRHFEDAPDLDTAVRRVLLLTLKSPRFLYRDDTESDGYAVASRLAINLWDSLPDEELLKAAAEGKLATAEEIAKQAHRMAGDPRAKAKLREFLLTWLKVDRVQDLSKDPEKYPEFKPEIAADLRTSLDLLVDEIVGGDAADFRQLLLADSLHLNGRLAAMYGAELPDDAPFTKVALEPDKRAGVLTHPYLLSGFAYTATSSPIHRGVFISRSILGRALRPPPEAVTPLAPHLHADLSTRERVAMQTGAKSCQSCHSMINPLGFTLENFDAVGRYRDRENDKPIDATGLYLTRTGETLKFNGVRELATYLAGSEEAHAAFVDQLFHYAVKQPIRAYAPGTRAKLRESFVRQDFNIRKLMIEMAVVAASQTPN